MSLTQMPSGPSPFRIAPSPKPLPTALPRQRPAQGIAHARRPTMRIQALGRIAAPSRLNIKWSLVGTGTILLVVGLVHVGVSFEALLGLSVLVLWLISPLIGAMIWLRKGGHAGIGVLGRLFRGPRALLMFFANRTTKKCPTCAGKIPKATRVCGPCRYAFPGQGESSRRAWARLPRHGEDQSRAHQRASAMTSRA
jgi:hypothetical protein